ncbi:MAG: RNA-directed DNA polymerase, partial [Methanothrix sp.]
LLFWQIGNSIEHVPKDRFSFRVATQFDPIDSLIISAIIHQFGSKIEAKRIRKEIVHSYRFQPRTDGTLFDDLINWKSFWSYSLEKAKSAKTIVTTDITDYYNQIYHHTVENQLELSGIPAQAVRSIMSLLAVPTQGVTRGIPIGPHTMHLIAEISFDPIDKSLISHGYNYCRFVDDIHIFCDDEEQAEIAIFDLARILDKQGRLVLNRYKTKIMDNDQFIKLSERKIEDDPIDLLERTILGIIKTHTSGNPYLTISMRNLSIQELESFNRDVVEPLLNSYLQKEYPDFIRIRWFIRRLAQVGVPTAIPFLIDHLRDLTPALGDIAIYLASAERTYNGKWDSIGNELINSLNIPIVDHSDYLKMVIINLFGKMSDLDHIDSLLGMYDKSNSNIKRKIVKAAAKAGKDYWLRENREDIPTLDPWLRRAFIFGAYAFSSDEKNYWLNKIKRSDNLLEGIIASWILETDPSQLFDFEGPQQESDEDSNEDSDEGEEEDIPEWAY